MKCVNCDFTREEDFAFCPLCGTPGGANFIEKAREIIKSGSFLAVCILYSLSTALSLAVGSVNVITILFSVFLWLSYSAAKSGGDFGGQLRNVSGTVYAHYVIMNVAGICLIVGGVLTAVAGAFVRIPFEELFNKLFETIGSISNTSLIAEVPSFPDEFSLFIFITVGVSFVIYGVIFLLLNHFFMKNVHRLAKSFYMSVQSGNMHLEKVAVVRDWLIAMGVILCLSTALCIFTAPLAALSAGCSVAVSFIVVSIINKYLTK